VVLSEVGFRAIEGRRNAPERHKPEAIVAKPRQVDVLLSQGRPVGEALRSIGVTQRAGRNSEAYCAAA
jgi:hypothetical protein